MPQSLLGLHTSPTGLYREALILCSLSCGQSPRLKGSCQTKWHLFICIRTKLGGERYLMLAGEPLNASLLVILSKRCSKYEQGNYHGLWLHLQSRDPKICRSLHSFLGLSTGELYCVDYACIKHFIHLIFRLLSILWVHRPQALSNMSPQSCMGMVCITTSGSTPLE